MAESAHDERSIEQVDRGGHSANAQAGGSSPPHLVRRFAFYAGVALVVAAVSAFLFVRHYSTIHAERTAGSHAAFIADSILPSQLRASDFVAPIHAGPRRQELDRLSRRELLSGGALRVKLYRPDGRVVYASDHSLIGSRPPDVGEVRQAFSGSPVSDVTQLNAEGGSGPDKKVLESYVQARLPSGKPVGVFELYADYAPIASDARSFFVPLMAGIAILLLGLYLSFFPILKRVTRTLQGQMEEIRHKAYHDSLTDLPNRILFNDRAESALREARAHGGQFAVILIDLDRFKDINDTLGHHSGDRLLRAIAANLPGQMRREDTVARLGGDEFGILAVGITSPAAVLALAQKVRRTLARPQHLDGMELEVDASIGVALYPEHGDDVETLIRRADVAMYRSKELHAPTLYDGEHDHYSPARLALVSELHQAISKRELIVDYQPQCDPTSGELRGVEALVRWQHPERGLLMPDEFVPLAEHTGLIRELTSHVLEVALRQCHDWQEDLDLTVAVNITGRDLLDPRFPEEVERLLRRWEVDPSQLELEITENTALTDPPRARSILARLKDLGVQLAIDDFGTGNSSLAYLKRLPVDMLKIDRSFVLRMLESKDDAVIVHSTIEMAHNLGLRVVAEGVASIEIRRRLAELGCDFVQGFDIGRPSNADAVRTFVAAPTTGVT